MDLRSYAKSHIIVVFDLSSALRFITSTANLFKPFPNKPWFLRVCSTSLLKTLWEKEKLLVTSNFSFSHIVSYPFGELYAIFHKVKNCRLHTLSVWKSLRFVLWKRVELAPDDKILYRFKCEVFPDDR